MISPDKKQKINEYKTKRRVKYDPCYKQLIIMKKIIDLSVTVTYTVQLSDVDVPDAIFEILENNSEFSDSDTDMSKSDTLEWLSENIKEGDALNWNYEVDDFS